MQEVIKDVTNELNVLIFDMGIVLWEQKAIYLQP
jgi:hypothetical protein